ncbi:hypothetical protein D3C78_529060 [compost metagenome]
MNTGKLGRGLLLGGLLASLAACAQAPWSSGAGRADGAQHCQLMQQQCQAIQAAKTPEERQKLMQEHRQAMMAGGGMGMHGDCPAAGAHGGMGMGHDMGHGMGMPMGAMGAAPTAAQLDQQIEHLELMLKQLKAQRAGMGK